MAVIHAKGRAKDRLTSNGKSCLHCGLPSCRTSIASTHGAQTLVCLTCFALPHVYPWRARLPMCKCYIVERLYTCRLGVIYTLVQAIRSTSVGNCPAYNAEQDGQDNDSSDKRSELGAATHFFVRYGEGKKRACRNPKPTLKLARIGSSYQAAAPRTRIL